MGAKNDLSLQKALDYLNYNSYFELLKKSVPASNENIAHYLLEDNIIKKQDNGLYQITNLGAILFAKKLSDFKNIERKAIRMVQYEGNNRLEITREFTGEKGYAIGFYELVEILKIMIPSKEKFDGAIRTTYSKYPIIALREIIANALIHQDFSVVGAGPIVEIFETRIEVSNPGKPLVDVNRIIDNPPKSRNEKLASLMRRLKMCEELGSGWDRIAMSCELQQLPSPKIGVYEESTKVCIYSEMEFSNIPIEDKIWACYLHACLKYVSNEALTNSSLRERFGLKSTYSASISRLIKDTVSENLIKPIDPKTAPRYMKYIPFWA